MYGALNSNPVNQVPVNGAGRIYEMVFGWRDFWVPGDGVTLYYVPPMGGCVMAVPADNHLRELTICEDTVEDQKIIDSCHGCDGNYVSNKKGV